jgi:endonuclease/exonuclease/phosphatase (EEP) superfamily protein YafD
MRWTRLMGVLTVVGIVVLAVAVVALIARFLPGINVAVVATAALAPYLMLGAPVAMIVLAVSRAWIAVAVAGAVTVATVAVQSPWYMRRRAEPGVVVRVVSANLRFGRADAEAVVQMARDHADILAVQELTPEKAELISAAGMGTVLPYQELRARQGPAGVGLWSRFPMRRGAEYDEFWLGLLTAQLQIPGVTGEATVIAAHMSAPHRECAAWREDLARLDTTLQKIGASADGPVLFAADLNATPDNLEFRRLLHGGYRDAAEQAGAGLTRTYPSDVRLLPPVFALDHILTRGCVAASVCMLPISGTDHRALLAEITILARAATGGAG